MNPDKSIAILSAVTVMPLPAPISNVNVVSVIPLTMVVVLALTVPPLANIFAIVLTGSLQNKPPAPSVNNCCPLAPSVDGYTCVPIVNADVFNPVK